MRGDVTADADSTDSKRIIRKYFEQIYAKNFDILQEMVQFLKRHKLPKTSFSSTNYRRSHIGRFLGEYEIRKSHLRIQMMTFPREWNSCQECKEILSTIQTNSGWRFKIVASEILFFYTSIVYKYIFWKFYSS